MIVKFSPQKYGQGQFTKKFTLKNPLYSMYLKVGGHDVQQSNTWYGMCGVAKVKLCEI